MAMAIKRAMATATKVTGDKEGYGNGGKSNGDGNEGGGRALALVKLMKHNKLFNFSSP
jgi:hypothetical protein